MTKQEMLEALSDARIILRKPLPGMRVIIQDREFIIVSTDGVDEFSVVHNGKEEYLHRNAIKKVLGYPMTVGDLMVMYVNKYHLQHRQAMQDVYEKYGVDYEYLDSKDVQTIKYFYKLLCC